MRMFQIREEDPAELETMLPDMCDKLYPQLDHYLRTKFRHLKTLLSEIRWNYGPPGIVEVIDADPQAQ